MADGGNIHSLNIKLTADPSRFKQGLDEAAKAMQTGGDKIAQQAEKLSKSMQSMTAKANDTSTSLRQQQRLLFNLAAGYEGMGKAGEKGFNEVTKQAIAARRRMEDVNDMISAADTEGKFKMGAAAIGKLTQGIAGAQGAMMQFGMSNETAAIAMAKLQGLMALSQGISAIASIDGEIKALVGSLNLATGAQKALNFAMSWSGAGIIAAVVAIGAAIYTFATASSKASEETRRLTAELDAQKAEVEALKQAHQEGTKVLDEHTQLQMLRARAAGKSEKEITNIERKNLTERAKMFRTMGQDYANSLDQRISYQAQALEMEQRLEVLNLNEIIKNREKAAHKIQKVQKAFRSNMIIFEPAETKNQIKGLEDLTGKYIQASEAVKAFGNYNKVTWEDSARYITNAAALITTNIQGLASDALSNLGESIGNTLAGAEGGLQSFGKTILESIGGFLQSLGKAFIAAATAKIVFDKALLTNPFAAAAAGIALVAAGAAITATIKKGTSGSGGDYSGGGSGGGIRKFADGGIITGPTLGLMGEYPGAKSNPEVVAPLDKLKSMIGGGMGGNMTTALRGSDLLIMFDRASKERYRFA